MRHLFTTAVLACLPVLTMAAQGTSLSSDSGRFVLGQISDAARDQFMLDTQTGRVWKVVCVPEPNSTTGCSTRVFQPMAYVDQNGTFVGVSPPPPSK